MTDRRPLAEGLPELIAEAPVHLDLGPDATIDELRLGARTFFAWLRGPTDPAVDRVRVRDDVIDEVPVRWYGPEPGADRDLVVFVHGGGWTLGDIESHDVDARLVAHRLGATVVSVEYRRAPEHTFPAAVEDCVAVVREIAGSPARARGIMGDSAGGNLALGTAVAVQGEGILDAVLALFPVIDPDAIGNGSYVANGADYLLTADAMALYWSAYAPTEADRSDPRAAPVRADLAGFPATVIATADFDPLRDEAREFVTRLVAADVDVTYLPGPGLIHGFQQMTPRLPAATRALEAAYDAFGLALRRTSAARRSEPVAAS